MSYDISVSFGKWPDDVLPKWTAEMKRMGVEIEFHPEFRPESDTGWLPLAMKVAESAAVPEADLLAGFGRIWSGFEYYGSAEGASFIAKLSDGNAAAFICSAALAAVSGGELYDPQLRITCTGGTGMEILSQLAESEDFEMVEPEEPHDFKGWDQEPTD